MGHPLRTAIMDDRVFSIICIGGPASVVPNLTLSAVRVDTPRPSGEILIATISAPGAALASAFRSLIRISISVVSAIDLHARLVPSVTCGRPSCSFYGVMNLNSVRPACSCSASAYPASPVDTARTPARTLFIVTLSQSTVRYAGQGTKRLKRAGV